MKRFILLSLSLFLILYNLEAQEQPKEILIVGTMHTVPKIVKHSYKPMLRRSKNYQPTAIYVESPMDSDTLSWEYLKNGWSKSYKQFYYLSDSLQTLFNFNEERYHQLLKKPLSEMTPLDLEFLIQSFAYNRDHANYEYYSYIKQYGLQGSKKPTRHEDGDLTFKLALALNIKLLNSMDDQQTNGLYHEGWNSCVKEGKTNGNNIIINKLNKKDYNSAILPAIFRGLGRHTNKRASLKRLHMMSSFSYVKIKTDGCIKGERYWNERNMRMAKNIAEQVIASDAERSIVIVGAAHVIGIEKELKTTYPVLKVVIADETLY